MTRHSHFLNKNYHGVNPSNKLKVTETFAKLPFLSQTGYILIMSNCVSFQRNGSEAKLRNHRGRSTFIVGVTLPLKKG
jgi:hypothetical protein